MNKKGKKGFWEKLLIVFTVIVIFTWILWLFDYDIREIVWQGKMQTSETLVGSQLSNTIEKQDQSITSCLNEIKRQSEIAEEKSIYPATITIKETHKFVDSQLAFEFLEDWSFVRAEGSSATNKRRVPDLFVEPEILSTNDDLIDSKDIVISLVKTEVNVDGEILSTLEPMVCTEGKLGVVSKAILHSI